MRRPLVAAWLAIGVTLIAIGGVGAASLGGGPSGGPSWPIWLLLAGFGWLIWVPCWWSASGSAPSEVGHYEPACTDSDLDEVRRTLEFELQRPVTLQEVLLAHQYLAAVVTSTSSLDWASWGRQN